MQALLLEQNEKERKFLKERMHMEQIQQSKVELSRKHRDDISARRTLMAREKEREHREREARIEDKL